MLSVAAAPVLDTVAPARLMNLPQNSLKFDVPEVLANTRLPEFNQVTDEPETSATLPPLTSCSSPAFDTTIVPLNSTMPNTVRVTPGPIGTGWVSGSVQLSG